MASKRKSTVPCMIPPKMGNKMEEEWDGGLPTCSRSPAQGGVFSAPGLREGEGEEEEEEPILKGQGSKEIDETSKPKGGSLLQEPGTHSCQLCRFETQDLNLFLDHVYSSHREPSFHCLDCGVSARKFEGLALHNARAHPSSASTTLQVRARDGWTTVEQSVLSGESEISVTRTPIMRRRGKGEQRRIAMSHTGEEPSSAVAAAPGGQEAVVQEPISKASLPSTVKITSGLCLPPPPKSSVGQMVPEVQNRSSNQRLPSPVTTPSSSISFSAPASTSSSIFPSPSSSSSSTSSSPRNLPKVMIPLSSIPTYDPAMDTSSFLRIAFSKFPYPTKAELCYLTVVTKYPEEQIKIWFTAQRLKQGISWSPEEIEDSRRKMFNTVIQPPSSVSPRHQPQRFPPNRGYGPTQQTVTVLPVSMSSTSASHVLRGSTSRGGVIVTQPVVANGITGSPLTLAVTPKPQVAAMPSVQTRPAAALFADKAAGVAVGMVGSSNRGSISSSSTSTSSHTSIISNYGNSTSKNNCNGGTNTSKIFNSGPSKSVELAPPIPGGVRSSVPCAFLDPSFYKSKKSQEQLGVLKQSFIRSPFPEQEEVERLTQITGLTIREVRKWFSDRRYHNRNLKGPRPGPGVHFSRGFVPEIADAPPSVGLETRSQRTLGGSSPSPTQQQAPAIHVHPCRSTPAQTTAFSTTIHYKSFALDPAPSSQVADRLPAEIDRLSSELQKKTLPEGERESEQEVVEKRDMERQGHILKEKERCEAEYPWPATQRDQRPEEERQQDEPSDQEPKVNPIKINLKMLKVTESYTKPETEDGRPVLKVTESYTKPETEDGRPVLKVTESYTKPETEDGRPVLKVTESYTKPETEDGRPVLGSEASTQRHGVEPFDWPVGLPRPKVVHWFGDSPLLHTNGQVMWPGGHQQTAGEEEEEEEQARNSKRDEAQTLRESAAVPGTPEGQGEERGSRPSGLRDQSVCLGLAIPEARVAERTEERDQGAMREPDPGQSWGSVAPWEMVAPPTKAKCMTLSPLKALSEAD